MTGDFGALRLSGTAGINGIDGNQNANGAYQLIDGLANTGGIVLRRVCLTAQGRCSLNATSNLAFPGGPLNLEDKAIFLCEQNQHVNWEGWLEIPAGFELWFRVGGAASCRYSIWYHEK